MAVPTIITRNSAGRHAAPRDLGRVSCPLGRVGSGAGMGADAVVVVAGLPPVVWMLTSVLLRVSRTVKGP
jgi:hypothetical protein